MRLDRDYISNGLRSRAQELATEELGPRLEVDIRRARAKEVSQERFTSLDRELERRAQNGRVDMASLTQGRTEGSILVARLQHLEGLCLAERAGPGTWTLAAGWKETLRDLGARGDILKQIHMAVKGDRSRYRVVRAGESLTPDRPTEQTRFIGRVASKGLSDELKGRYYAVLETPSGDAYHVPIDARAAEQLRVGDLVAFSTRPVPSVRPADRGIAESARRSNGTYLVPTQSDGPPHPHLRRLHDLERMGLVVREGDGRWKVRPDLVDALEERGRIAPPRHGLFVRKEALSLEELVRHRGEVWLDRVRTPELARHGFGADVGRAQARRFDALRRLGIEPGDSNRAAKLQEVERLAVGEEMAARSGKVFVARAPEGFRGRVGVMGPAEAKTPYVSVSDGSRFVLVPATPALQQALGRVVELSRDRHGNVRARLDPGRDMDR